MAIQEEMVMAMRMHRLQPILPSLSETCLTKSCPGFVSTSFSGLGCDRAFRGAYWCSQGVNSSQYNLVCNQETFRMVSQRHISRLPETVHGGNPYEKDVGIFRHDLIPYHLWRR